MKDKLVSVIEKILERKLKENKRTILSEFNSDSLDEVLNSIDDYIINIEMLIDEHYQDMEYKDFKKAFNQLSSEFEKELNKVVKNKQK